VARPRTLETTFSWASRLAPTGTRTARSAKFWTWLVCVLARVVVPEALDRRDELLRVERRGVALEPREAVALEPREVAALDPREVVALERRELAEAVRRLGVLLVVGVLPAFELLLVAIWCLTPFP